MKKTLVAFLVLAIILVAFFVIIEVTNNNNDTNQTKNKESENISFNMNNQTKQLSTNDTERMDNQMKTEAELQEDYAAGSYSFDKPFVQLDPYDAAPLTALAMFETDEPVQITVTVEGKTAYEDIQHTYDTMKTKHSVPILGLYPDSNNTVTIKAANKDGETMVNTVSIKTAPLPEDFLAIDLADSDPEQMENGLTFIVPSGMYAYALDQQANVRWYSSIWNRHIFKRLDNDNLLFLTQENGQEKYNEILEMDMMGKVYNSYLVQLEGYKDDNPVHHEVIELPNGNLLATVHDPDSKFIEDELIEIDRDTGETVRNLSFQDIFPTSFYEEYNGAQASDGDWFHNNAIWYNEQDDSILISSRHQDLAMKMSYPEGEIEWILGSHEKWPEQYEKYLLEPKGDNFKFPGAPHAIMPMPDLDNNGDTTDYLLFDNNIVITRGDKERSKNYSRGVQYRINAKAMTVEEVWSFGEERGYSFYSNIVGDANYYPDTDNRLITSGYTPGNDDENRISRIVEVTDDQPAEVVYEVAISGFKTGSYRQAYRALRLPIYLGKDLNYDIVK